jgi:aryl carrier-like protein
MVRERRIPGRARVICSAFRTRRRVMPHCQRESFGRLLLSRTRGYGQRLGELGEKHQLDSIEGKAPNLEFRGLPSGRVLALVVSWKEEGATMHLTTLLMLPIAESR